VPWNFGWYKQLEKPWNKAFRIIILKLCGIKVAGLVLVFGMSLKGFLQKLLFCFFKEAKNCNIVAAKKQSRRKV